MPLSLAGSSLQGLIRTVGQMLPLKLSIEKRGDAMVRMPGHHGKDFGSLGTSAGGRGLGEFPFSGSRGTDFMSSNMSFDPSNPFVTGGNAKKALGGGTSRVAAKAGVMDSNSFMGMAAPSSQRRDRYFDLTFLHDSLSRRDRSKGAAAS